MNDGFGTDRPAKLAVMLSGSGRTLMNLLDAMNKTDAGRLDASVPLVIASRECLGAERARERGLTTIVEPGEIPADRLDNLLEAHGAGWVALAGYLLLVNIPPRFEGRVVNIHPALLPRFGGAGMYGLRVHRAVIDAGHTESGCTVHLCDRCFKIFLGYPDIFLKRFYAPMSYSSTGNTFLGPGIFKEFFRSGSFSNNIPH